MNRRLKLLHQRADDVTFVKDVHQNTNFDFPVRKRKKTQQTRKAKNLLHTAKEYSIIGDQINSTDNSRINTKKPHVYTPDLVTDDPLNYRPLRTEYNHSFLESRVRRPTPLKSETPTTTEAASPGLKRMDVLRRDERKAAGEGKPLESIR